MKNTKTQPKTKKSTGSKRKQPMKPTQVAQPKETKHMIFSAPVLCEECEQPIPPKRLASVNTTFCVSCMEQFELVDKISQVRSSHHETRGTRRHTMEFEVEGVEEVESITQHIRRA